MKREPGFRVVLTMFGSLGDLHPLLALAIGLRDRGHDPVIATSEHYRPKVEGAGIGFRAVRPETSHLENDPEVIHRLLDPNVGPEVIVREVAMGNLLDSFDDTLDAADGADLLVSHPLTFATRLVAEKKGLPWASTMLTPLGFLSAYDPPALSTIPFLGRLRFLGPTFHRPLFALMKWLTRSWVVRWHELRAEIGLPPTPENPVFEGQHSPCLVLCLFSELLGRRQQDWPPKTVITGFPLLDRPGEVMPPDLERFLTEGPPPVVFTLGSAAVHDAGPFYEHSAGAAKSLGLRAALLTGKERRNRPAVLPPGVVAFEYAPYSRVFPRAAAVVHSGGVGTTAEAMRAGRPMLIVPFAHDQPDNADRAARLGVARVVRRGSYSASRAAGELRQLLNYPRYAECAAAAGRQLRSEDGVTAAVTAIESLMLSKSPRLLHRSCR